MSFTFSHTSSLSISKNYDRGECLLLACFPLLKPSLTNKLFQLMQTIHRNNMTSDNSAHEVLEDDFAIDSSSRSSSDIETCGSIGHETIENILMVACGLSYDHFRLRSTYFLGIATSLCLPWLGRGTGTIFSLHCHELLIRRPTH
jgi:hypothetical protein